MRKYILVIYDQINSILGGSKEVVIKMKNDSVAKEEILKYKLEKLESQKELYWRQRAKAHWLQPGDRNTKYFHQHASERRKQNKIRRLVKDDGSVTEDMREIHALVTEFYSSLFQSHAGHRYEELLHQVPSRVTENMNEALMRDYFQSSPWVTPK